MPLPIPPIPRTPGTRYLMLIGPLALIAAVLLVLVDASMETLSAGRAYVAGEGLWSKAQKDSVYHLLRYARDRDRAHYDRYLAAIAIPLGDRKAREALDRPQPDYAAAQVGFIEGRNHPDDVEAMARLFVRFRNVHYVARAIDIWAEADTHIERLRNAAQRLHGEIGSLRPDVARINALLAEINDINNTLEPLEDDFSYTLGEATRWMRGVLFLVMLTAALLLVALVAMAVGGPLRRADAAEAELREAAGQLERNARRLEFLAHHDNLTQLPNRSMLQDRVRRATSIARRHGRRLALLFIDLDHFKGVNDTLGHSVGDQLLQVVALRLQGCVREEDLLARLGGDEFCVLLENIDSQADAGAVAQKLLDALSEPYRVSGQDLNIAASIGIACLPEDGADMESLLKNADIAMYRAKAGGRNSYRYHSYAAVTPEPKRIGR
jgi:diguanylate cyclase (GGDEF)-like protein